MDILSLFLSVLINSITKIAIRGEETTIFGFIIGS